MVLLGAMIFAFTFFQNVVDTPLPKALLGLLIDVHAAIEALQNDKDLLICFQDPMVVLSAPMALLDDLIQVA